MRKKQVFLIDRIWKPIDEFAHTASASGIVLLLMTVVALLLANSGLSEQYFAILETHLAIGVGEAIISKTLLHWISDGLMAIFFFHVGLEIKRELISGELSTVKNAALPIFGALGGMVMPAILFNLFNSGTQNASGWGIPMATDIAFALGVVSLLGKRVPPSLKIFLVALAIIDDIGAVVVIALFYTSSINMTALIVGFLLLVFLMIGNLLGIRSRVFYSLFGIGVWYAFLLSGVHATVAGVLVAFTIPTRQKINIKEFYEKTSRHLSSLVIKNDQMTENILGDNDSKAIIRRIEINCERVQPPLARFEQSLHIVVSYIIMPIFVLANAGVRLETDLGSVFTSDLGIGIILGLVLGKPLGITLFTFASVKLGFAQLPAEVQWRHILSIGLLGGIGFTMSLFITGLAFSDLHQIADAKLSILIASISASLLGWLAFSFGKAPAINRQGH